MQTTVLTSHPGAALAVFVVWVPTLAADSLEIAQATMDLISDPRAVHFYDERRLVGRAVADSLGGKGNIAWDCYLFYRAGPRWEKRLPPPDWWMHQLGPSVWADPARFRWQDSLTGELRAAAALFRASDRA